MRPDTLFSLGLESRSTSHQSVPYPFSVVPIQGITHSSAESGATSAEMRTRIDHGKGTHARPSRYVREVRNSTPTTSFVMQLTGLLTPLMAQM